MKNPKHTKMISSLAISTTLYDASLLTNIVEKLATRRNDRPVSGETCEPGWQPIGTSSLEAFVSGTAEIPMALIFSRCHLQLASFLLVFVQKASVTTLPGQVHYLDLLRFHSLLNVRNALPR